MIDLIIYIEIALVVIFLIGQKVRKDKPNTIASNIMISFLVTAVGLFFLI